MADLKKYLIRTGESIHRVIQCIDSNRKGIALVVDGDCKLVRTVTDGDIRRAILAGVDLAVPVSDLMEFKAQSPYHRPITASVGTSRNQLQLLMAKHSIRHIPLLDDKRRVIDLYTMEDNIPDTTLEMAAVVMAGGYGTRLSPLTDETPKPMLPIGGRPILEWIVEGLQQAGIRKITLTTHYKSKLIVDHFGNGHRFGVDLEYVDEEKLSGTAGPLRLVPAWHHPLLVINGDILTRVNFKAMLHYHQDHQADMTIAVFEYQLQVPYGVVDIEGVNVRRVTEKPAQRLFVNAGIYLLEPLVREHLLQQEYYNMTDLIACLLGDGRSVVSFPVREYWIDIGQHADYERAQADVEDQGGSSLGELGSTEQE